MMDATANWLDMRASEIVSKLARLSKLDLYPSRFHDHPAAGNLAYSPTDLDEGLEQLSPAPVCYYGHVPVLGHAAEVSGIEPCGMATISR